MEEHDAQRAEREERLYESQMKSIRNQRKGVIACLPLDDYADPEINFNIPRVPWTDEQDELQQILGDYYKNMKEILKTK